MRVASSILIISAVVLLTGCETRFPSVHYDQVKADSPPNLDGNVKFNLYKTILKLDKSKDDDVVVLQAIPGESESRLFQITPDDPWLVKTSFQWTKRDNTNLLQSVGTDVVDNRVKTMQAIGGALVSVISLASVAPLNLPMNGGFGVEPGEKVVPPPKKIPAAPPTTVNLPLAIDTEPFLKGYGPVKGVAIEDFAQKGISNKQGDKVKFKIEFGPVASDAIPVDIYLDKASIKSQHAIFTSACREAKLKFIDGNSQLSGLEFTSVVADPNYVQVTGFPNKGTIKFHSACGADVLSEKADVSTGSELVNESMAQAKSLSEAWATMKKKKEDADKAK